MCEAGPSAQAFRCDRFKGGDRRSHVHRGSRDYGLALVALVGSGLSSTERKYEEITLGCSH